MTKLPSQWLDEIAKILYDSEDDEIDAWAIYDDLDSLFEKQFPEYKKKYNQSAVKELIRQKEHQIIQVGINLENLQKELEGLKSELV